MRPLSFALACLLFLGTVTTTVAQRKIIPPTDFNPCPIPEGGCSEPWSGLQVMSFPVTCGSTTCMITVYFKCRLACVGSAQPFRDLSIGWFESESGFLCGACMSAIDLMQIAVPLILKSNISCWPPVIADNCVTTYRVQSASCFQQYNTSFVAGEQIPEFYWWTPCSQAGCCISLWQVCNRFNVLIPTQLPGSYSSGSMECANWTLSAPRMS